MTKFYIAGMCTESFMTIKMGCMKFGENAIFMRSNWSVKRKFANCKGASLSASLRPFPRSAKIKFFCEAGIHNLIKK